MLTKAYQEPQPFKNLFHAWVDPKRPLTLRVEGFEQLYQTETIICRLISYF